MHGAADAIRGRLVLQHERHTGVTNFCGTDGIIT
jgi:hypothetical protein